MDQQQEESGTNFDDLGDFKLEDDEDDFGTEATTSTALDANSGPSTSNDKKMNMGRIPKRKNIR
jgi:hypothetical protein